MKHHEFISIAEFLGVFKLIKSVFLNVADSVCFLEWLILEWFLLNTCRTSHPRR